MPRFADGPASARFSPLPLKGNYKLSDLPSVRHLSKCMREAAAHAPSDQCVSWGIPFHIGRVAVLAKAPLNLQLPATRAGWLVFLHTSDLPKETLDKHGFPQGKSGVGHLGELAARYIIIYADGSEVTIPIRRRYEVGAVQRGWGDNCFQAVGYKKPRVTPDHNVRLEDQGPWVNWLYAWQNPHPRKEIVALRLEPVQGVVVLSALSAGEASSHPLRWETRQKAILRLPTAQTTVGLEIPGLLEQVQLDMGAVSSVTARPLYPQANWRRSYNNQLPALASREALVEYSAHPDARFHLPGGKTIPVKKVASGGTSALVSLPPANQRVTLRTVEKTTGKVVPVRLHVHGEAGEYLPPVDAHRFPKTDWNEDRSVDFVHNGIHPSVYISGETTLDLPLGKVYLEISKGFEIRPLRRVYHITRATKEIVVELDKVLDWRERGWVSADTHVHFLSPGAALLEGAGEGVNVVNLLASQWGELMTNAGDFDGRTTWGAKESGGDGEHLVRVGTENRQHVLGHISLLGYEGNIIAPMTTGGPDEAALGDPVECLLTEWAQRCKAQNGVVVLPHFPNPRAEHAATIITGKADAVEMTSWGFLYGGISPYSLTDWYRYLNNGYLVAAVGGTDKMSSTTAVGTVRTYARLLPDEAFTYEAWKKAVRAARTFATYGPLLEFSVEGKEPGARLKLARSGGTLDVHWRVASVTVPMSRVELVVNGEIRESQRVLPAQDEGHWSIKVERSSWLALLVRGHYHDKPEIIAAHSSPVMVEVEGMPFYAAADAVSILEQIEGALAYLDSLGTRASDRARKRMRLVLTSAHRSLHNRMHQQGHYHRHTATEHHAEHSR